MEFTVNIDSSFTLSGETFEPNAATAEGDVVQVAKVSVPAAKAGTLTTRGSDTAGTVTLSGGHGVIDADRLDLYWDGGARRGAVVGTVAGDAVPFTGGAGDALPAEDTAIRAVVPSTQEFSAILAEMVLLVARCDVEAQVVFTEAGAEVYNFHLQPTSDAKRRSKVWFDGLSPAPTGTTAIDRVYMSHGDTSASRQVAAMSLSQ